jgi:hypothetical protein
MMGADSVGAEMDEFEVDPVTNECSVLGKQLIDSVRAIVRAKCLGHEDQRGWKAAVFEGLGNIGRARGFKLFHGPCSGLSTDGCEFLLDLIWYSDAGGIEMGAECEWGEAEDVFYDFRKLVYVKAPLKVLVYWAYRKRDDGEDVRQRIERYMEQYTRHVAGEQYLFLEFGAYGDDRCYCCVVREKGTVGAVSLCRLV